MPRLALVIRTSVVSTPMEGRTKTLKRAEHSLFTLLKKYSALSSTIPLRHSTEYS